MRLAPPLLALLGCAAARPSARAPAALAQPAARLSLHADDPPAIIPGPSCATGAHGQFGGRRVSVDGVERSVSSDVHAAPLVAAAEVRGAWVFVDALGTVSAAPGFTAPARVLGQVPGLVRANPWSAGRLAITAGDGLWLTDGAALARAPVERVVSAAFLDADFGAAARDDGELLVTRDGGATWDARDLGGRLAIDVASDGDAIVVETTRGAVALTAHGLTADAAMPGCTEGFVEALADLAAPSQLARPRALALPDGSAVETSDGVVRHLGPDGSLLRSTRLSTRPCQLAPWGAALALRCDDLFRTTDGDTFELVDTPPAWLGSWRAAPDLAFSDDGLHAAFAGACSPYTVHPEVPQSALCLLDPAVGWRTISVPDGIPPPWRLTLMHGDAAELALDERDATRAFSLRDDGVPRPIDPPTATRWAGAPGWTADGVRFGLVRDAERSRVAFARGDTWTLRDAPAGARAVAFEDERHGVAVGDTTDALWRTLDGGRRWERVILPTPEASSPRVALQPTARCARGRCELGGLVAIDGWGPRVASDDALVGAGAPTEDHAQRPVPFPWAFDLPCERTGPRPATTTIRAVWGEFAYHHDGARDPARPGWIGWRVAEGPWRRTAPLALAEDSLLVASEGALVASSGAGLRWVTERSARDLAIDPTIAGALQTGTQILLPDVGGGVVGAALVDPDTRWFAALALDRGGAVTASRNVLLRDAHDLPVHAALAHLGGRWGVARFVAPTLLRFHALEGVDGDLDVPVGSGAVTACADAPASSGTRLWARAEDVASTLQIRVDDYPHLVAFELNAGAACVRAVSIRRFGDDGVDEWIDARAEGGALVGERTRGVAADRVRCTVAP